MCASICTATIRIMQVGFGYTTKLKYYPLSKIGWQIVTNISNSLTWNFSNELICLHYHGNHNFISLLWFPLWGIKCTQYNHIPYINLCANTYFTKEKDIFPLTCPLNREILITFILYSVVPWDRTSHACIDYGGF
jgi:hypothetical protein